MSESDYRDPSLAISGSWNAHTREGDVPQPENTNGETLPSTVSMKPVESSPFVNIQVAVSQQKKQLVRAFPCANGQPPLLRYTERRAREHLSHD